MSLEGFPTKCKAVKTREGDLKCRECGTLGPAKYQGLFLAECPHYVKPEVDMEEELRRIYGPISGIITDAGAIDGEILQGLEAPEAEAEAEEVGGISGDLFEGFAERHAAEVSSRMLGELRFNLWMARRILNDS
jgi:hypothetical protein